MRDNVAIYLTFPDFVSDIAQLPVPKNELEIFMVWAAERRSFF